MNQQRYSGILLHPSSLPGNYGIGSFGREAYTFVNFLEEAGQKLWQILPLGPTGPGDSPYQSFSAFALNPLLIDLEMVAEKAWITTAELETSRIGNAGMVDYGWVNHIHHDLLHKAFQRFKAEAENSDREQFGLFCREQAWWLDNYALFMAVKEYYGWIAWYEWPDAVKKRKPQSIAMFRRMLQDFVEYRCFLQYIAYMQWNNLKAYANEKNIRIIGDIPLYISYDSADAWANPGIFLLDKKLKPVLVAGVPPDFFSADGQLWGNPVYNWPYHIKTRFDWWKKRMSYNFRLADIVRIDHFRGLAAYWAVPFGSKNAVNGEWIEAPGDELLKALSGDGGKMKVIAEDLGYITPDVDALREKYSLPGMKILQFGFDQSEINPYAPHFYTHDSIVYTGTHDNNTVVGWFNELSNEDKQKFSDYTGCSGAEVHWKMIQMAMASVSDYCVLPLQDVLGLGAEARMNIPGTASGNWRWRMKEGECNHETAERLRHYTKLYNR